MVVAAEHVADEAFEPSAMLLDVRLLAKSIERRVDDLSHRPLRMASGANELERAGGQLAPDVATLLTPLRHTGERLHGLPALANPTSAAK